MWSLLGLTLTYFKTMLNLAKHTLLRHNYQVSVYRTIGPLVSALLGHIGFHMNTVVCLKIATSLKTKPDNFQCRSFITPFLAHLSRRLIGELIVYPWSGVCRPSLLHNAQTSSQKLLGRSKPNLMWSLLG